MKNYFKLLASNVVILLAKPSTFLDSSSISDDLFGFNRLKQDKAIRHRLKGIANIIEKKLDTVNTTTSNNNKFLSFIGFNINDNGGFCNG